MNISELQDLQWLLVMSKSQLKYSEQVQRWTRIQKSFREQNEAAGSLVNDLTGTAPSLDSCYQD